MSDTEETIEVVDKRSSRAESDQPETTADVDTVDNSDMDSPTNNQAGGLPALPMRDRLIFCLQLLHQGGWVAMGLVRDPATNEFNRNLDEARRAIDCMEVLFKSVDDMLDDSTRRELRAAVQDMRLNYVHQVSKGEG